MQESKTLFDETFQALQQQRHAKTAPSPHPLEVEAIARLEERLADIKRDFPSRCAWKTNDKDCDLITSTLTLQKANDLRSELASIHAALANGGLFLGIVIGSNSFHELRTSLMEAEIALTGGAAPRVAPLPDAETLGRLLTSTRFALPVVDVESIVLDYPDIFTLMQDLRAYGCTNALSERSRRFAPRGLFKKAHDIYASRFALPSGGIAVTIDLVFLHGWKEVSICVDR